MREPFWLAIGREMRAIAQIGLEYCTDSFDRLRFERIRELAATLLARDSTDESAELLEVFQRDKGYATPKVDVRGAVFKEGQILLVREISDGNWTLPGGWADVNQAPAECVEREIREESGFETRAIKLVAVHDYRKRNAPRHLDSIYKLLFICKLTGGAARPSDETSEVRFVPRHALPPLSLGRTTPEQVELLYRHAEISNLATEFD